MTREKKMTLAESLRAGANLPDCQNPEAQKEAADKIERIERINIFIDEITARLSDLESRVKKLETSLLTPPPSNERTGRK